jgi:hypothetical protein
VPILPIKCWSVYARNIKGEPLTNNNLEAWHKQFEEDARIHPTVNTLIQQFRLEPKNTEVLLSQLEVGDNYSRKQNVIAKDEKIFDLVSQYNKKDLNNFMNSLCLVLSTE